MASPGHNGLTLWGLVKSYSNILHLPLVQVMAWCLTWANAISVSVEPLGTNFNGIFIKIHWFSFMKLDLEMLSAKWPPFWWGLDVIMGGNVLLWKWVIIVYIDGLVKERRNSIANALELRLSCTNPSTCPCGGIHIQCGAVVTRSIFSQIFTKDTTWLVIRLRYGCLIVDPASDWYFAPVSVIINVISYNIGLRYNGTQLY